MLSLRGHRRDVPLASGSFFLRCGTIASAAAAAVKADAITGVVVLDSCVVDVPITGYVDMAY